MNPTNRRTSLVQRLALRSKEVEMNFNKKLTHESRRTPSVNTSAETARPSSPAATRLKTRVAAQTINHPIAPPVYRPHATPKAAQLKMANGAVNRGSPMAPSVHQPHLVPNVLPAKVAAPWTGRLPSDLRGTIQQTPASCIQLTKPCATCGSRQHGTSQHYLTVNTKANPRSDAHQQSKLQRTLNSFRGYRGDFFGENNVTTQHIDLFFKAGYSLHGHGSGGGDDGENQATIDDANAFVGWFRKKYLQ